jgi:hypothetical protein
MPPSALSADRVRQVKHWLSGSMALRGTDVAFDAISRGIRRIMDDRHLWVPTAALDEPSKRIDPLWSKQRPENVASGRGHDERRSTDLGTSSRPRTRP